MFKFKTVDHLPEGGVHLPNKLMPFIWFFVRQAKWHFFILCLLFSVGHGLYALLPYFFGEIVDVFSAYNGDESKVWETIKPIIFVFVGLCFVLQPIIVHTAVYLKARIMSVFTNFTRRQLSLYMYEHSYGFYQSDFSGRLAGKIVETPSALRELVDVCVSTFLHALAFLIVSVVLLASVSIHLLVACIALLTFYAILMFIYVPKIKALSETGSVERSHVRGRAVDILGNILTIKLFANKKNEDAYFREKLHSTASSFVQSDLKVFNLWVWLEAICSTFWLYIIWYCITMWASGDITTGQVAMILPLTFQLTEITWKISTEFTGFFQKLGEIEEGMEAITKPHELLDNQGAKTIISQGGLIQFSDVNFSYGEKPVFTSLNLDIPAGQKIGLVGPSGAGKSSLVQIILRLYDIQSGAIKIDGQDISKVIQDSLRRNIAVIPQDTSLFHRSLMDNIRYGRLDASDDEVIEAAKRAHAHEFIADLPDGYDTMVGERGVKLSGGQRQRIAIARAILKDAPILILDEATSALDSESERLIQDSLKTLMEGKTVIAIAHRLSTIAHLDRLIVMHEGQIVEDGTHDDLRAKKDGHYAKLWAMQSGGFLGE